MQNEVDCVRRDLRRLLALLAIKQLDAHDAIDWARSLVERIEDCPGLRLLAECDHENAAVWLCHVAENLGVEIPSLATSAEIVALPRASEEEASVEASSIASRAPPVQGDTGTR
jgi:hypothetical protein